MIRSTDPAQMRPMRGWMDPWYLDLEESQRKFLVAELPCEQVLGAAVFPQGAAEITEQSRKVGDSSWGSPFSSFSDALGPFDVMRWP